MTTDESSTEEEQQPESPLKLVTLNEPSKILFKFVDLNKRTYWREVRRIIYNNMDANTELKGVHYFSFMQKFDEKGREKSKWSKPWYDAWCLVIGRPRNGFLLDKFLKTYPTIREHLRLLKLKLNISTNKPF